MLLFGNRVQVTEDVLYREGRVLMTPRHLFVVTLGLVTLSIKAYMPDNVQTCRKDLVFHQRSFQIICSFTEGRREKGGKRIKGGQNYNNVI